MEPQKVYLNKVYDGWEGYNRSLVRAVQGLARPQLDWRPSPFLRSAGQIASHIAFGRIGWFERMVAPGSAELAKKAADVRSMEAIETDPEALVRWLNDSWDMIRWTLDEWTLEDLSRSFRQPYEGVIYAVPYQWVIWRIIAHDHHHGGELALTLGLQGIPVPDLGDLGGHLTLPPVADD